MSTMGKIQASKVEELLTEKYVMSHKNPVDIKDDLLYVVKSLKKESLVKKGTLSTEKVTDYKQLAILTAKKILEIKGRRDQNNDALDYLKEAYTGSNHVQRLAYVKKKNGNMYEIAAFLMRHNPQELRDNVMANYKFYMDIEIKDCEKKIDIQNNIIVYLEKIQKAVLDH